MEQIPTENERRTVTLKKATELHALSVYELKQLCLAERIEARFIGGRWLVYVDSLDAYVANAPRRRPTDGAA